MLKEQFFFTPTHESFKFWKQFYIQSTRGSFAVPGAYEVCIPIYIGTRATVAVATDRDDEGFFFFLLLHEKRTFAAGRREWKEEKDTAAVGGRWHTGRSVTRIIRLRRKRVYENIIITKGTWWWWWWWSSSSSSVERARELLRAV